MEVKDLTGYLSVEFLNPVHGEGLVPALVEQVVEKAGDIAVREKVLGAEQQRTVIGHDVIGRGYQRVIAGNAIELVNADGGVPPEHTEYRLADGMNFVKPLLPWMKNDSVAQKQ